MLFFGLPHASLLLLLGYFGGDSEASTRDGLNAGRVLRPATKRADLYRRDVKISKRFEAEMFYVESRMRVSILDMLMLINVQERMDGLVTQPLLPRSMSSHTNPSSTSKRSSSIFAMCNVLMARSLCASPTLHWQGTPKPPAIVNKAV